MMHTINLPAVWISTTNTSQFGLMLVPKPNPLLLGGANPSPYPLIWGRCQVWQHPLVPISGSGFWVFLLLATIRYPTVKDEILTLVRECLLWCIGHQ